MPAWNGKERRINGEDGERIAVLETNIADLIVGQKVILERLDALSDELTKYRGFAAGVIWVVGGVGAVSIALWEFLRDHLK